MCSVLKISKLNVSLKIQFFFLKRVFKLSSFLQPAGWLLYVLRSSFQESEESERWIIQICSQVCNNGKKAWLEGFAEFLKPACDLTVATSAHFPVYDWNILKKRLIVVLNAKQDKKGLLWCCLCLLITELHIYGCERSMYDSLTVGMCRGNTDLFVPPDFFSHPVSGSAGPPSLSLLLPPSLLLDGSHTSSSSPPHTQNHHSRVSSDRNGIRWFCWGLSVVLKPHGFRGSPDTMCNGLKNK